MKITTIGQEVKFIKPIEEKWKDNGYEVRHWHYYDPKAMKDTDIIWFEFCENNIIQATKKPAFIKGLEGKQIVCRIHAYEAYKPFYLKVDWTKVDDLVFVAPHIRRKVIYNEHGFKFPKSLRIHTIHNGIDMSQWSFKEREDGDNFVYYGNAIPDKGIVLLMHLFDAIVRKKKPNAKLYIVGKRGMSARMNEYIDQFSKDLNIKWHKWLSRDALNSLLDDTGINYVIQPSLAESFSFLVGECMAKGIKPLINRFMGAEYFWPKELTWRSIDDALALLDTPYDSKKYRRIAAKYPLVETVRRIEHEVFQAQK